MLKKCFYKIDAASESSKFWYLHSNGKDRDLGFDDFKDLLVGKKRPVRPIQLILKGNHKCDLIGTYASFSLTERLVGLFNKYKISGWSTYKVSVCNLPKMVEGIYGLRIDGKVGPLLPRKDYKFDFDPKTWDGSDWFVPNNTTCMFAHERLIEVLKKEKIRGWKARCMTAQDIWIKP